MRRQLGTALSVVGLVAIAGSAAAINVKVLQSDGSSTGAVLLHKSGAMTVMNAQVSASPVATTDIDPSASPTPVVASPTVDATPTASAAVTPSALASASAKAATKPRAASAAPSAASGLAPVGAPALPFSDDDQDSDGHIERQAPPQLTQAQMDVLRVAAMAHVPPELVLAVARGDAGIDAALIDAIQKVAKYANVDLASLANVTDVPRLRDRGHGAPNTFGGVNTDS